MLDIRSPFLRATAPLLLSLSLLAPASLLGGCGKKESIVATGDGRKLSADEIDADPLALLPGGAIVLAQLDAAALMTSPIGPQTVKLSQALVPLTPEMNFQPSRDLKSVAGAAYSMQGADAVVVAQGTFDADAIRKAADKGALSALGKQLTKTTYAGNDLYLTGDVGFVVLTNKTLLGGNPAGMRRALDRLRDGRLKREIPDWMSDVLKTSDAKMALAGDFKDQSVPAAVVSQVPFLNRIQRVRMLGDFKDPGMNFAGALTYPDPPTAQQGEAQVKQIGQMSSMLSLLAFMGISSPLRSLNTNVAANDVQFVAAVDGPALARLMDQGSSMLPGMLGAGSPSNSPGSSPGPSPSATGAR